QLVGQPFQHSLAGIRFYRRQQIIAGVDLILAKGTESLPPGVVEFLAVEFHRKSFQIPSAACSAFIRSPASASSSTTLTLINPSPCCSAASSAALSRAASCLSRIIASMSLVPFSPRILTFTAANLIFANLHQ